MTPAKITDEAVEALLPCPFCRGPAVDGYHESFSTDSSFPFIGCERCGVEVGYSNSGWRDAEDRARAVSTWNTRAQQPTPNTAEELEVVAWITEGSADMLRAGKAVKYSDIVPTRQRDYTVPLSSQSDALAIIEKLRAENEAAENYLRDLLTAFVTEHFPNNESWKPLPDLLGMLSQMDNASTVARDYKAQIEKLRGERDNAIGLLETQGKLHRRAIARAEAAEQAADAFAEICDELGVERDNEAGLIAAANLKAENKRLKRDRDAWVDASICRQKQAKAAEARIHELEQMVNQEEASHQDTAIRLRRAEARLAALEKERDALRSRVEFHVEDSSRQFELAKSYASSLNEAAEALRPFAAMADELEEESLWRGVLEHDHPLAGRVNVSDFHRARTFLQSLGKEASDGKA